MPHVRVRRGLGGLVCWYRAGCLAAHRRVRGLLLRSCWCGSVSVVGKWPGLPGVGSSSASGLHHRVWSRGSGSPGTGNCRSWSWMFPSSYRHEIFWSYNQWQKWRPCKRSRSKVKVTEVTTQLYCFRTVTPVWIHVWWWNDAYSLIMLRRGALLFFKVICQISRSHGSKNRRIWPRLGISGL